LVTLVALAAPLPAAKAHASADVRPSHTHARVVAGPVLAGGAVIWGQRDRRGGLAVRTAALGSPSRTLYAVPPPRGRITRRFDALAASETHVAFAWTTETRLPFESDVVAPLPTVSNSEFLAGPIGGPYRLLSRVRTRPNDDRCRSHTRAPVGTVGIQDNLIAYVQEVTRCRGRRKAGFDRVVLRRLGSRERLRVLARSRKSSSEERETLSHAGLAGDHISWRQDTAGEERQSVVVFDHARNRTVQIVRAPQPGLPELLEWVDLQDDGKLLVTHHSDQSVAVFEPGRQRIRVVPMQMPNTGSPNEPTTTVVRLAGDRIALIRHSRPYELVVSDLAGDLRRLDTFDHKRRLAADFDFDGGRITWAARRRGSRLAAVYLEPAP
jgi:hypothetical protein